MPDFSIVVPASTVAPISATRSASFSAMKSGSRVRITWAAMPRADSGAVGIVRRSPPSQTYG